MGDGEQNNPFRFLRVWTLPLFLIVPYTVVWVVYFLIGISRTGQLLSLLWIYLWVFFWIWWQFARLGISWRRLIGELPDGVSLRFCIGSAAMLFVFSSASIWLVLYPLSYLFPVFAQEQLNGALNFWIPQSDNAILFGALVVLLFFCVAPVVEELFFRGVLLHRLKLKWGLLRAILASSAFFALAHLDVNIVGRIAVGFVMSVLYLKTRTILVPIFCHVVLNVLAMSFKFVWSVFHKDALYYSLAELQSDWWVGLLAFVLSGVWLAGFLRDNIPDRTWSVPYFLNRC